MENNIKLYINEVLTDYGCEKVILFGSRFRGDHSDKSDFDILIILKEKINIEDKINLSTRLRKKLAKKGIDADIIIKSKEEVEYYKNRIGNIVREALKEGVAI